MFAANPTRFPEFVADQILTAQNLTNLFNYVDEQERLTRTNLIGIGIVCGLEVFVSSTGNALTITQGVGITSAGYLVAIPQQTYTFLGDYNAEKDRYYDRFVDLTTKKQLFPLQQLAVAGSPEAKTALTADQLKGKVVLVFVELIENGNKNCDPDSCDDKGITVDVAFRPLLVEEKNIDGLIGSMTKNDPFRPGKPCVGWPEVRMPRYNVPSTTLPDSASILKNFLTVLNESFLQKIETTLTSAYGSLQLMVAADFNQNPFIGLKETFSFLFDGSLGVQQLLQAQYYYDFFSDLLQAYDELRRTCQKNMALCCPDEDLFPRHLLLGSAFASKTVYRHTFIPSPALGGSYAVVGELRFLFARLVQLTRAVEIPVGVFNPKRKRTPIVVTPSQLGNVPLSEKAIPYYYDVLQKPALFDGWNFSKTQNGQGNTNLSYHAPSYNNTDDHVRFPLKYDLEPYNFFRIEGHIGQPWQTAFRELYQLKQQQRLPFDVVAMNGDFRSLIALLQQSVNNLGKLLAEQPEKWRQILCYFSDIEMQYDMQAAELRCTLGKVMKFLYNIGAKEDATGNPTKSPVSTLLRTFDSGIRTKDGSLGSRFDDWYPTVKDQPDLSSSTFGQAGLSSFMVGFNAAVGTRLNIPQLLLMYYLEKIHEALPNGIVQLNIDVLTKRLRNASDEAENLLSTFTPNQTDNQNDTLERDYILNLNAVMRVCKASVFTELYRNFLYRFYLFMANQSFAMFSFLNSGIQHKAGVPVGGTFILVYHDALPQRDLTNVATLLNTTTTTRFSTGPTLFTTTPDAADKAKAEAIAASSGRTSSKVTTQFRDITSIKQTGEYWLTQLLAARTKEDELTDKELLELVDDIPDGVVIADFYLPYVCASECAPMSYIVLPEEKTEPTPDPVKLVISGQVTDVTTGKPIQGGNVILKADSRTGTVTDADGKYSLTVPDNTAVLVFTAIGYEQAEKPVGNDTKVNMALKPVVVARTITGRVTDVTTGKPLPGASILLKGTTIGTTADINGAYSLPNVSGANTILVFSLVAYESLEKPVGTQTVVDAALKPTPIDPVRSISGQVVDKATGEALPGVSIVIKGTNQGTTTDANAKFRIGNVSATTVLVFSFVGYDPLEITVGNQTAINAGMTRTVVVIVDKCTSLSEWSSAFAMLDGSSANNADFKQFTQRFGQYAKVVDAFKRFDTFKDKPQADQLLALAQVMPPASLQEWLQALRVVSLEFPTLRKFAMELVRILTGVMMFYSCVPKDDIDKAQIKMFDQWAFLTDGVLPSWKNIQNFSPDDKGVIKQMLTNIRAELAKTTAGGKAVYIRMLKTANDILSSIPQ